MTTASCMYECEKSVVRKTLAPRLSDALSRGLDINPAPAFFFRADDIGVPSRRFFRLMDLFAGFNLPLNLAVVPAWITRARWESMALYHTRYPELFCWHQHGWRHMNHEPSGKKQEFGPARSRHVLEDELAKGKMALDNIIKDRFSLFFTPPWNRCSMETMKLLSSMGFRGISRHLNSRPPAPAGLAEFPAGVDLHTRKETSFTLAWDHVFSEIRQGMATGMCGIMLHHMRMNDKAFEFLECLLEQVAQHRQIQACSFDRLADKIVPCDDI